MCERDRTAVLAHESRPSGVRFSGTVLSVFTLRAARNPARDPVAVIVVFVAKVIVGGPAGAEVPGWAAFSTPLTLPVAHGVHTLVLNDSDAIDEHRQISVEVDYDHQPEHVAAPTDGPAARASVSRCQHCDVAFMGDGRLALSMAVPTGSTSGSERALP